MGSVSLDREIRQYLPLLGIEEKKSLLSQIKLLLNINDVGRKLTREEFLIQYNKELVEAEAEIEAGHIITQEVLEKESENW